MNLLSLLTGTVLILHMGMALSDDLTVIGWVERVSLQPYDFVLDAKIDTGADNSSIDAAEWHQFQRDGKEMIRFLVRNNDERTLEIEAPFLKFAKIKRKRAESVKRPVVNLEICVANKLYQVPVNLADRGNYKYRMLVGRSALKDKFLVDSSKKLSIPPVCN